MAIGDDHSLQVGWLHRHLPHSSGLAVDVAVLDIAQDFLLSHLEEQDIFRELVIFKGGTALRKLFAGANGRFSTDLDLAIRTMAEERGAVASLIAELSNVTLGPFAFVPSDAGGRWRIRVESEFGKPYRRSSSMSDHRAGWSPTIAPSSRSLASPVRRPPGTRTTSSGQPPLTLTQPSTATLSDFWQS